MRIYLPEELDKEFRTIIASKYGLSKDTFTLAIQEAILKWIIENGKEPWLYIDSNMSLELHKELIICFFEKIFEILSPQKIAISFQASQKEREFVASIYENFELDGEDIYLHMKQSDFVPILTQLIKKLNVEEKHSLLIELDNIMIIGGGAGCLSICGDLSIKKFNQIVIAFLKELNIEVQSDLMNKQNYQLILLNPKSIPIEIYKTI
ncbi:MAG: hypothetical protein ACTSYB_00135 [Candidatus Helarchaeota archaeon]